MLSSITLKILWQIVSYRVPIWFALIGVVVAVYALNRPAPQRIETEMVFRDYWQPPSVTQVIPPSKIIQYEPVPMTQIRVDTVYVPVDMRTYQLWQPEKVHRRTGSVVVRSFNPSDISYRDYEYKPLESKYGSRLYLNTYSSVFEWNPGIEIEGVLRYQHLSGFSRIGLSADGAHVVAGIKVGFK
jgi:hypothetical protein